MTIILLLRVGGGAKLGGGGGIQELGLGTPPNSFGGRTIDPDSTGLEKGIYLWECLFIYRF